MRGNCKIIVITSDDDAWTTSVAGGLMGRHRTHVAAAQVLLHRGAVIAFDTPITRSMRTAGSLVELTASTRLPYHVE